MADVLRGKTPAERIDMISAVRSALRTNHVLLVARNVFLNNVLTDLEIALSTLNRLVLADIHTAIAQVSFYEARKQVTLALVRFLGEEQVDVSQTAGPLDLANAADTEIWRVELHASGAQPPFAEFLADRPVVQRLQR